MPNRTFTQVPLVGADIGRILIDALGSIVITYQPKNDQGVAFGPARVVVMPLTPPQQATLQNFVVNVVVPFCNDQENT